MGPDGAGIDRIQKEAWGGIGGNVMKNTLKKVRTGMSLGSFPEPDQKPGRDQEEE